MPQTDPKKGVDKKMACRQKTGAVDKVVDKKMACRQKIGAVDKIVDKKNGL